VSSKRLMQPIIVDFPEPEGPQTTTRSPFLTSRLMSLRTWKSPNHLSTWRSLMMGSPGCVSCVSIAVSVMPDWQLLTLLSLVELALEHLAVARHEEAEAEIDRRDKDVGLDGIAAPIGVGQCSIGGAKEIEQANDQDERGVLEGADKIVDQGRDHQRQSLRQHDEAGPPPIAQPQRNRPLRLAPRDRLQA